MDKDNQALSSRALRAGTAVVWPRGVEEMFGIGPATRWRWERFGRLPARDVNLRGKTGWRHETIAAIIDGAP